MDLDYLAYVTADPVFYDVAWRDAGASDLGRGDAALPVGWTVREQGPWLVHLGGRPLPPAGWKVHVACRPEDAVRLVSRAVATCLEQEVAVKCLRSRRLVRVTQAKYAPPASAGKVVTAYPVDEEALERLVRLLVRRLAGEPGARVVGDVGSREAPVSVRYGAFAATWTTAADGSRVPGVLTADGVRPDRRSAGSAGRAAPEPWPTVVRELADAEASGEEALPFTDARLLHRSTAGGVYRGRWSDGRDVVVKEARRHTGFDDAGADAVTRLRHEHAVLLRLAGTGVAPEPVALVAREAGEYLVMERVPGTSLSTRMAIDHPGAVPGGVGPAAATAYADWAERVVLRTRRALAAAHARGVVHRDVHPSNVLDVPGPDGTDGPAAQVVLVDWESAALDGVVVATGVQGVAGAADERGPAADRLGVERLGTALLTPLAFVLDRRPGLVGELERVARADLAAGGRLTPMDDVPAGPRHRIAVGLAGSATPERQDRLFPGDVAQLRSPTAGAGLLHGAAGVLLALRAAGEPVDPAWSDWLAAATARAFTDSSAPRGLADGLDGLALAVRRLGLDGGGLDEGGPGAADRLLSDPGLRSPWWGAGHAGLAVAAAELGLPATAHVEATLLALDTARRSDEDPPGHRPGLLRGWAGVALGLLRVAELDPGLAGVSRDGARRAVQRERARVVRVGPGALARDGAKLLPYVGEGVAALGWAAAVLEAADGDADHDGLPGAVAATLRCPVVMQAGLLRGRAGNLAVLDLLAPGDPAVEQHRRRLAWHTLPAPSGVGDLVLGEQNLRCSADLGTGAAGLLLALGERPGRVVAEVLALPGAPEQPA